MPSALLTAPRPEVGRDLCLRLSLEARARTKRGMLQFASEEITIYGEGPHAAKLFNPDLQPFTRLWLSERDTLRWNEYAATGCVQSGKTTLLVIIPTLFHTCELEETVIVGVPHLDLARAKWEEVLLPAYEASRYRDLLPTRGIGSRGGTFTAIQLRNGRFIRFMGSGGGDANKSSHTARVIVMTEVDKYDEMREGSRLADPVTLIKGRARAHWANRQIYMECSASIKTGRIWQEITRGSDSRLMLRCPHCRGRVQPEREHLRGWQEAADEIQVIDEGCFVCPACSHVWSEDDRRRANLEAVLVHKGQTIDSRGRVKGAMPGTLTFGFRWSAVNNLFTPAGFVAAEEWQAQQAAMREGLDWDAGEREENAERELCQSVWAIPFIPSAIKLNQLTAEGVASRTEPQLIRGIVPEDVTHLVLYADVGLHLGWFSLLAMRGNGQIHVVEYGPIEMPPSEKMATDLAVMAGLRSWRDDMINVGWDCPGRGRLIPQLVLVDSGWETHMVYNFCRESGERYCPAKGYGQSQRRGPGLYSAPMAKNKTVRKIGDHWHVTHERNRHVRLMHIDADFYKLLVQKRLTGDPSRPGALTLFAARQPNEHLRFSKHTTNERYVFDPDKEKWVWVKTGQNHLLDATAGALAGLSFSGADLATGFSVVGVRRPVTKSLSEMYGKA